jgi:hypothetical protein
MLEGKDNFREDLFCKARKNEELLIIDDIQNV